MKANILSRKHGWYLARVNASIKNFANIVATSFRIIKKYNLQPGRYIKVSNLNKGRSKIEILDKFILLPFFKEFIKNFLLLQKVIQSITNATYQYVDREYFSMVIKLMNTFYQERNNKKGLIIKEFYEVDNQESLHMNIAMPESWLNENSVDLGDTVLLRNDVPSLFIF